LLKLEDELTFFGKAMEVATITTFHKRNEKTKVITSSIQTTKGHWQTIQQPQ
jgi:hypothetical protein